jgi:hypothetical protein
MAMSVTDLLIALPLIPIAPIVITWWLPWEKWIPDNWGNVPKAVKNITGPYFLYVSFAWWYFFRPSDGWAWWLVFLGSACLGAAFTILSIIKTIDNRKR